MQLTFQPSLSLKVYMSSKNMPRQSPVLSHRKIVTHLNRPSGSIITNLFNLLRFLIIFYEIYFETIKEFIILKAY